MPHRLFKKYLEGGWVGGEVTHINSPAHCTVWWEGKLVVQFAGTLHHMVGG